MSIYRGPGGSSDATSDATSQAILAAASAVAAATSEANAAASATSAAASASAAATSATNAASSASTASTQASNASTSATNAASSASLAASSASAASTSATNAASSASAASTSATNAASSATSAANSATTATTQATNAANSATAAASSATSASNSASAAATSETNAANSASSASTSATNAANSATSASGSASTATTQASNAASSATAAATSASSASTSATNAASSASSASTSATNASNSASSASTSATTAANSASAAATSATNAAASAVDAQSSEDAAAAYAASINPALFMHLAGTETVTGSKTFSVNPTLSGGTANGVAYLNGSKVLTTGSSLTFDGTNFATTGSVTSSGTSNSGNLTFTGTGNRITGEFSNTTVANRVVFQTSTVNGNTIVTAIPNGTGTQARFDVNTNPSDPQNASTGAMVGVKASDIRFQSAITGTGTYLPMTFYTGGSERVRIDSSGNVGIGTSSPYTKLQVVGLIRAATDNDKGVIGLGEAAAPNQAVNCGLWRGGANSAVNVTTGIVTTGGNYLNMGGFDGLVFTTGNAAIGSQTERMRIDSSGNLLVGTTSNNINAAKVCSAGGAAGFAFATNSSNIGGGFYHMAFGAAGALTGSITGSASTVSYNTSSDYRLKENIQPMQGALAVVQQLNPVTYTWKVDGSDGQGFIAHELQAVVPDCVTGEKDAVDAEGKPVYQGIDTSFLVATLTKAIQELNEKVTQQAAEIAALKGA